MYILLCVLSLLGTSAAIFCPGLGNFDSTGPFVGWPDPTCPGDASLNLRFTMYREGSIIGIPFDRDSVPNSFVPTDPTLFVVHGWTNSDSTPWVERLRDVLVTTPGLNSVLVNWDGNGGSNDIYARSCSTTRTVGAELAEVMTNLITSGGSNAGLMHCAGHSLGSHVCGHFGRWADNNGQKPGRITGLDPAGPNFDENPDRAVGLYTDCADFVHIMHTDQNSGSTPEPGADPITLGHQDFYPNDGHNQPGCATDTCSHMRVTDLFTASITNGCFEATGRCTASNDLPGSCSACVLGCPTMGYHADPASDTGIFRLDTTADGDFCV